MKLVFLNSFSNSIIRFAFLLFLVRIAARVTSPLRGVATFTVEWLILQRNVLVFGGFFFKTVNSPPGGCESCAVTS